MLNSDQIFDAIEAIAAKPGKKDKEAGVAALLEDINGLQVLTAAYDPFTNYGIAKLPGRDTPVGSDDVFDSTTFSILKRLSTRELSGNEARMVVQAEQERLSVKSAALFGRIIKKDLRAGFTDGTINRVRPGTLMEFPYMRCSLPKDAKLDKWKWDAGCFSQVKADGMFANVNVYLDGTVSIHSRQGTPFPECDALANLRSTMSGAMRPGFQYHGELLVVGAGGELLARQIGNGMLNAVSQGGELDSGCYVVFHVWDRIPLTSVKPGGRHDEPYVDRLKDLITMLKGCEGNPFVKLIETRVVHSLRSAYAHSTECMARGLEGTIIKNRTATWKDSTSKEQVKLKLEVEVDLKITGVTKGTGKRASTFGALCTATSDDLLQVDVGTGLNDKTLAKLKAMHDAGELAGTIATVKINNILYPSASNPLHSAFLPVFVELRTDKTEADSLQRVIDQVEAAVKGEVVKVAA